MEKTYHFSKKHIVSFVIFLCISVGIGLLGSSFSYKGRMSAYGKSDAKAKNYYLEIRKDRPGRCFGSKKVFTGWSRSGRRQVNSLECFKSPDEGWVLIDKGKKVSLLVPLENLEDPGFPASYEALTKSLKLPKNYPEFKLVLLHVQRKFAGVYYRVDLKMESEKGKHSWLLVSDNKIHCYSEKLEAPCATYQSMLLAGEFPKLENYGHLEIMNRLNGASSRHFFLLDASGKVMPVPIAFDPFVLVKNSIVGIKPPMQVQDQRWKSLILKSDQKISDMFSEEDFHKFRKKVAKNIHHGKKQYLKSLKYSFFIKGLDYNSSYKDELQKSNSLNWVDRAF